MLSELDLIPKGFDWVKYTRSNYLKKILNIEENIQNLEQNYSHQINKNVDPNNRIPFAAEFDDLARLHYIAKNRKVTTILEFGVGKSSIIFADALRNNKSKFFEYTSRNLRKSNLYQCYSVDNNSKWIKICKKNAPEDLLTNNFLIFNKAQLKTSEFVGRICTFFDPIPNISPDLIYLDAPDQFSAIGNIRGISTKHSDRMPMSADIISIEHFLQPGTLIVIDGRTANARFLEKNLQRNWSYLYAREWDQHFFELQEEPLGIYNEKHIEHCLGKTFYERF